MKKYLVTSLVVFLSIGLFALVGPLQAVEDHAAKEIVDGAKQMMDGNQKIMAIMEKKGIKDPELTAAEKEMKDGYDMIMKGQGEAQAAEGKKMMTHGAKMMLDAQTKTAAVIEKKGMVQECKIDLSECTYGEQKIKEGALEWFFGM
jgi:formate-dependent nitrite reductase cytochrome c552 subunit